MKNGLTLKALLAAGALAVASVSGVSAPAQAAEGRNTAAVLGAAAGFAAGAAIAGQPRHHVAPVESRTYYARPVRERVIVEEEPECRVRVKRVVNQYGEMRTTRTRICR